jgi:uncharacterized protein YecE (DUF72 family)
MSTRWHIGAKHLRGAIAAYAKRFDLLEVRAARSAQAPAAGSPDRTGADGAPGPSIATMRRWRKSVPPHFDFAVVAGPHLSRVKTSDVVDQEIEAAIAAIDALQARCFVLRTPPDVTPTSLWRDRIGKIIARIPHDVTHFVWEPSGVWEMPDAAAQAREWGVVLALDPSREMVPSGPIAYLRLRGLGETQSFSPIALERIVNAVGARRDAFVIIETDTAQTEAKRLRQLSRKSRPETVGGAARLIRPRGDIIVRDDEQE